MITELNTFSKLSPQGQATSASIMRANVALRERARGQEGTRHHTD
jgi:hypothetical protein